VSAENQGKIEERVLGFNERDTEGIPAAAKVHSVIP
jgi:hypothetical protein